MKTIFYMHGGSKNHGCEALVLTLKQLLAPDSPVCVFSASPGEDQEYIGPGQGLEFLKNGDEIPYGSLAHITAKAYSLLFRSPKYYAKMSYSNLIDAIEPGDVCYSIGGDNYCYDYNGIMCAVHAQCRAKGAKTILVGASVSPQALQDKKTRRDLGSYDGITVRESLSYEALRHAGITHNVKLIPDSAFLLPVCETQWHQDFFQHPTVGLNISPLISNFGDTALISSNYECLIQYILDTTDYHIALIPHVVAAGNDDRVVLSELNARFPNQERLLQVPDMNCRQLKHIISQCQFFIGARTHATIAAYSTGVPTLAVGYSIKARGIAQDLFGSYENYVVPVQDMQAPDGLKNAFAWLRDHAADIHSHLDSFLPGYKTRISAVSNFYKEL